MTELAAEESVSSTSQTPDGTELRSRLSWLLLVRLTIVSAFFLSACVLYLLGPFKGPDPRIALISVGYGVTAISGLLLPGISRVFLYAAVQIGIDLGLVSLGLLFIGIVESPLPVLYNLVILNAALLRLQRGITLTATAAAFCYTVVLAINSAASPSELLVVSHALTHATNLLSFYVIAALARYLTAQLTAAETLVQQHREEIDRIEALQSLVAESVDNGLIFTDATGRITSANPTAVEILGLRPGVNGAILLDAILPEAATVEPNGVPVELTVNGDGQEKRVLRVKAARMTDTFQHPIGRVLVVQDVTTVRDMEARLREQEDVEAAAARILPLGDTPVVAFEGLVGESEPMRRVYALIEKAAPSDATILVTGESGTGKELIARAAHARSPRSARAFVAVNCGAIPDTLIESELFGHVRGAFTGAVSDRPGLFRQAHGGTIFLDEIAELSPALQVRLLRVLQDRMITPVGGSSPIAVDVRVVAATNRDLERLITDGRFREDLFYRLNVIRIATPPLRERPEDIPVLLLHMLRLCSERHGKAVAKVSPRTMRTLVTHAYPGNIRELENVIDHAVTLCEGETLTEEDLPGYLMARPETATAKPAKQAVEPAVEPVAPPAPVPGRGLDDQLAAYEKEMLMSALERAGGVRKRAADLLGIKYRSLRHRLAKYGLALGEDDESEFEHNARGLTGL